MWKKSLVQALVTLGIFHLVSRALPDAALGAIWSTFGVICSSLGTPKYAEFEQRSLLKFRCSSKRLSGTLLEYFGSPLVSGCFLVYLGRHLDRLWYHLWLPGYPRKRRRRRTRRRGRSRRRRRRRSMRRWRRRRRRRRHKN